MTCGLTIRCSVGKIRNDAQSEDSDFERHIHQIEVFKAHFKQNLYYFLTSDTYLAVHEA